MSLSASMWTAVTGLLVHGEKMNVVGNNIANVNTVGFKGSRMDFEDFVNQTVYAASGPSQVGRGVSIGAIYGDFSQGSFENSTNPTDLAINGNGFFKVKPIGQNTEYYTRAGNFRFNADGYLVDPHGYALQGWSIDIPSPSLASTTSGATGSTSGALKGTGAPVDVKLESFTCDPKHTTNVMLQMNLSADASSESTSATNPFFAMFEKWDAGQDPALGTSAYSHQETMFIFDEGGSQRKLTVYFDRVDQTEMVAGVPVNRSYWEYVVTMDPADDHRDFTTGGAPTDKTKGVLMIGTMEFDSSGQLQNMSAYVPSAGGTAGEGLDTWVSAPISSNGFPLFCPNFSGAPDASTAWNATFTGLNPNTTGRLVELNFGLRNTSATWASGAVTPPLAADLVGQDPAAINAMNTADIAPEARRTTSFAGASGSINRSQNGYTFGYLSTVYVDRDGILYGKYSNGETLALYQIALYDFTSPHMLHREGGNLFSQTRESGDASSGPANNMGLGSISGNSLEQSNVDLATEFVNMITTQRGFQANSKSITTVDTMLETVIGMKR